ncbi:MAG: hypothetical protein HC856_01790, partial [Pseudanabaena sp. RU_4_16]|nr:hypothetical protein [Pseudanabaena sp. RU_4_16]
MKSSDWKIELSWQDPTTSEQRQEEFTPPIAVGKDASRLPVELSGEPVAQLVIADGQISRYHALIALEPGGA